MLHADSISKEYPTRSGPLAVLRGASLRLESGEAAVIMGPSGSGKSTLLNILGTLETPSTGKVDVDGVDPFSLPPKQLARYRNAQIGFVFQDHHLLPQCTVLENVLLPTLADAASKGTPERARHLLDRVGLTDRLEHRPAELSGGERQRTALARALINRPTVILADEPTGNLDQSIAEGVAELLVELHRDEKTVLIVVTHSRHLADRIGSIHQLSEGGLIPE